MKKMTKRLFGLVMAGVMMLSLAISVSAAEQDPFDYYNDFTIEKNGCIVRDDVVYDRDGEVVVRLNHGMTPDGYPLMRGFQVCYLDDASTYSVARTPELGQRIFDNTVRLPQNVNGTESVVFGNSFNITEAYPYIYLDYISGDMPVNIAVRNNAAGYAKWWRAIQTGTVRTLDPGVILEDNDQWVVAASGQGQAGFASLSLWTAASLS